MAGLSISQSDGNDEDWVAQGIWDQNINYFVFLLRNQYDSFTFQNSRIISRRSYFGDATFFTREMLKAIRVEPELVESYASEIYSNASAMAENPNFIHSRILTLTINVITPGSLPPDHDENETPMNDESEDMNDEDSWTSDEEGFDYGSELAMERAFSESAELFRTVPATKSSIVALKEVKVDDLDSTKVEQCSICLEKLLLENKDHDDQVVVSMPCSHLYHRDCIVRWLETSHVCPLCRYALPT